MERIDVIENVLSIMIKNNVDLEVINMVVKQLGNDLIEYTLDVQKGCQAAVR